MSSKPKAYVYIRWSSGRQTEGDTLRRQHDGLERFKQTHDVEIAEVLTDEGVSAFRGKNLKFGKLKELTDRVDSGEIRPGDYIVIESIDRLTRQDFKKSLKLVDDIMSRGVVIYTTSDGKAYDQQNPNHTQYGDFLYLSAIANRANDESRMKQDRVASAWRWKRENAIENLKKGKVLTSTLPAWLTKKGSEIVIREDVAQDIRKIFELLKYQGIKSSIQTLNKNYRKSQHVFNERYVNSLLTDKRLYGTITLNKTVYDEDGSKGYVKDREIVGYYPSILDEGTVREVRSIVSSRYIERDSGRQSPNKVNLFRHILFCGVCGRNMTFRTHVKSRKESKNGQYKSKYFYLECANARQGLCSAPRNLAYDIFEDFFIKYYEIFNLGNIFNTESNARLLKTEQQLKDANEKYGKAQGKQEQIESMMDLYLETGSIPDTFKDKAQSVARELEATKREYETLKARYDVELQSVSKDLTADDIRKALDDEEQRKRLNAYLKSIQLKLYAHRKKDSDFIFVVVNSKNLGKTLYDLNEECEKFIDIETANALEAIQYDKDKSEEETVEVFRKINEEYQAKLRDLNTLAYYYNKKDKTDGLDTQSEYRQIQYSLQDCYDYLAQQESVADEVRIAMTEIKDIDIYDITKKIATEES